MEHSYNYSAMSPSLAFIHRGFRVPEEMCILTVYSLEKWRMSEYPNHLAGGQLAWKRVSPAVLSKSEPFACTIVSLQFTSHYNKYIIMINRLLDKK